MNKLKYETPNPQFDAYSNGEFRFPCPYVAECGMESLHAVDTREFNGDYGQRYAVGVLFHCEAGHAFEMTITNHKGDTHISFTPAHAVREVECPPRYNPYEKSGYKVPEPGPNSY